MWDGILPYTSIACGLILCRYIDLLLDVDPVPTKSDTTSSEMNDSYFYTHTLYITASKPGAARNQD